jgi:hypothetical protein
VILEQHNFGPYSTIDEGPRKDFDMALDTTNCTAVD